MENKKRKKKLTIIHRANKNKKILFLKSVRFFFFFLCHTSTNEMKSNQFNNYGPAKCHKNSNLLVDAAEWWQFGSKFFPQKQSKNNTCFRVINTCEKLFQFVVSNQINFDYICSHNTPENYK